MQPAPRAARSLPFCAFRLAACLAAALVTPSAALARDRHRGAGGERWTPPGIVGDFVTRHLSQVPFLRTPIQNEPNYPLHQKPSAEQQIYLLHITKCAGESLLRDISQVVGREKVWAVEGTYNDRNKGNFTRVVTMLRNPRDVVLSTWQYCQTPEYQFDYRWHTGGEGPAMLGFEDWVSVWADLYKRGLATPMNPGLVNTSWAPFGCLWPVDVEMRAFTSPAREDWLGGRLRKADVGVQVAIDNMMATDVVGLAEAYQESLCLFHAIVLGKLPGYCDCTDAEAWGRFHPSSLDHGNAHTQRLAEFAPSVLRDIDVFTSDDRPLYEAATARFMRDVRWAEKRFGVKILCHDLPPSA